MNAPLVKTAGPPDPAPAVTRPAPVATAPGAPRSIKPREEGPFYWVAKAAARRIASGVGFSNVAYARAVYGALAEMASNRGGCSRFEASNAEIRQLTGLGEHSVRRALAELEAAGLITVEERKATHRARGTAVNLPNVITILSVKAPSAPRGISPIQAGARNATGPSLPHATRNPYRAPVGTRTAPHAVGVAPPRTPQNADILKKGEATSSASSERRKRGCLTREYPHAFGAASLPAFEGGRARAEAAGGGHQPVDDRQPAEQMTREETLAALEEFMPRPRRGSRP